jgi:hypothetical protein
MGAPVAIVDAPPADLDQVTRLLTAQPANTSAAADGRYAALGSGAGRGGDNPAIAASRASNPAGYRILYFPDESHSDYEVEGSRERVKISNDTMVPGAFSPLSQGGGRLFAQGDPSAAPKTAREYVAPDQQIADAAARLSMPRADGSNVAETSGVALMAEYRQARVRYSGSSEEIPGLVRPLGIAGTDDMSVQAAKDALDRRAGERLVYFPQFGWGGFVPAQ